jgi:OHCU decarboxylase
MSGTKPSTMTREAFLSAFGDVFEHTPEIAAATFDAGLTAAADTAKGLHTAMLAALRKFSADAKERLILAHPDLAGRLARAGKLTADSSKEQASAGLDQLTDEERDQFSSLNHAYKMRFDIPFIMAIKGRTKAEILAAFEERLDNDGMQEFGRALAEIEKIALLRLRDRLPLAATG